jgi:hypothetical protein
VPEKKRSFTKGSLALLGDEAVDGRGPAIEAIDKPVPKEESYEPVAKAKCLTEKGGAVNNFRISTGVRIANTSLDWPLWTI